MQSGIAGAVLAGGQASRYGGIAKGLLSLSEGGTIIERMLGELRAAGVAPLAISANDAEPYRRLGLPIVSDVTPGQGPLGGIVSALTYCRERCRAVLFLPCDLPGITAAQIGALCDAFDEGDAPLVAARTESSLWHPLCAVVDVELLPVIAERAACREREPVWRFWVELGARAVDFADARTFFNVNTPAEMARWTASTTANGRIE